MKIVFSLREDKAGLWCICIGQVTLFSQLQLAPAIRLARTLARDEHHRSGRHVAVELPGPDSTIELAHYRHSPEAA
ncbi:hypothetical protein [Fulvimonas soli]|jgi:hypothetical protein|uniref:Uncharacterized protein n=1 Tax=Fulvimonas soli TaxID=155197 RepID=A0A316HNL0_9GAMM|nr:hypothetical protein [Fulvimonas soli]PWK81585.1 hypothetical protein C7456_12034 [Fulvimonas soli]TNY25283.1 hypothetical protein BV497_14640 [Fulvimonas soli]